MSLFRRKPQSFETNLISACQRLRPDLDWKHDHSADRVTGGEITINLTNLRITWERREEDQRAAWLEGHLSELLFEIRTAGDPIEPDDLRAMIRPRVLVESARLDVLANRRAADTVVPHIRLSEDLIGVLGVDAPSSIRLVSQAMLTDLGGDFDTAWIGGIHNVSALSTVEGWTRTEDGVFVSNIADDYTNSRLLAPDYLAPLEIDGPAVVLVPHRNSLIVAPFSDDQAVATACSLALQELSEPASICAKPFIFDDGTFSELQVSSDHLAWSLVAQLRLIDQDVSNKQMFVQLSDVIGDELHIGNFFVDSQRLTSSTNWGPSPSLLPCADEILFLDDDTSPTRGMVASWDAVMAAMRPLLAETDHYPVRYRTTGLPDPQLIRSVAQPLHSLPPF